jgi:hypothetical protein
MHSIHAAAADRPIKSGPLSVSSTDTKDEIVSNRKQYTPGIKSGVLEYWTPGYYITLLLNSNRTEDFGELLNNSTDGGYYLGRFISSLQSNPNLRERLDLTTKFNTAILSTKTQKHLSEHQKTILSQILRADATTYSTQAARLTEIAQTFNPGSQKDTAADSGNEEEERE